jgi:hypothetical protein
MSLPPLVLLLVGGATGMMIWASLVIFAMIGKVNRRLPDDQQVSYLWGYPGKLSGIKEKYKRFYPKGALVKVLNVLTLLALIMMVAAAVYEGFATGNYHLPGPR